MQPAKMGHTAHVCEVYSIFPVTQKYCQTHHPKKNRCGRKVDGGLEEGVFVVKVTPAAVCTVKVTPKGPLALGCSPPPGWGVGRAQPGRLGAGPPAQLPSLPPSSVFSHHPVPTFLSEHPPSFLGPGVLLGTSFSSRTLKGIAPAVSPLSSEASSRPRTTSTGSVQKALRTPHSCTVFHEHLTDLAPSPPQPAPSMRRKEEAILQLSAPGPTSALLSPTPLPEPCPPPPWAIATAPLSMAPFHW